MLLLKLAIFPVSDIYTGYLWKKEFSVFVEVQSPKMLLMLKNFFLLLNAGLTFKGYHNMCNGLFYKTLLKKLVLWYFSLIEQFIVFSDKTCSIDLMTIKAWHPSFINDLFLVLIWTIQIKFYIKLANLKFFILTEHCLNKIINISSFGLI